MIKSKHKLKPPPEIQLHWAKVAELGCMLTGRPNPTLHHCHSGSVSAIGVHRGVSQKPSPWLVIPLDERYHTGAYGIDSGYGVLSWERDFGTQVELLDALSVKLNINLWRKVGVSRDIAGMASDEDVETWMN